MTDAPEDVHALRLRQQLADKNEVLRNAQDQVNQLRAQLAQSSDRLSSAQDKLDDQGAEIEELRAKIIELTGQMEEVSVSPLDLAQQQRVKALTASRDVVAETGSAGVFTKTASARVSLAGVVSTAHFIITGERDYVVGEGEFIQRQNDDASSSAETVEPVGPGGIAPLSDAELNQVGITRTEGGDDE